MSEAPHAKPFLDKGRRPYLWRKLHSLTGVIPVGAFMCFHLFENAKAMQGQQPFDEAVAGIGHTPFLLVAELFILVPLLFHAVYGVWIALNGRNNVGRYPYTRNWMYTLQRVTGMLAFAFIVFHLSEYWWPRVMGTMATEQFYPQLCAKMSSKVGPVPVVALVYVLGIAASVFHFVNGLWGFCFSWGITVSRRAQRAAAAVFFAAGLGVFLLGFSTVLYLAKGVRIDPRLGAESTGARTCADVMGARVTVGEPPHTPRPVSAIP